MAKRRSFRKRSRRIYRKKRSYRRSSRRAVRRTVRRAVARTAEVKSQTGYNLGQNIYSSAHATFPSNNMIVLGPNSGTCQIAQGVQQGYRIGNKVTTKSLWFKGTFRPNPYNATSNPLLFPQQVRMIIFYDRSDPNVVPSPGADLFQLGNVNQGFNNDLTDLWRPFNTDRYRILTQRTYKLGFSNNNGTGAPGVITDYQFNSNNDFRLNVNFKINLTKYYPKIVKFDENNLQPMTRGLYALIYCCAASGGANGPSTIPLGVEYMFDYKYTDL